MPLPNIAFPFQVNVVSVAIHCPRVHQSSLPCRQEINTVHETENYNITIDPEVYLCVGGSKQQACIPNK